jgi:hypothetical protein
MRCRLPGGDLARKGGGRFRPLAAGRRASCSYNRRMSRQAADFDVTFQRLRSILEPYGQWLHVIDDSADGYSIDMAPEGARNPTTWFAGVRRGKAYVSYYLMPVYVEPTLVDDLSPELRKRMQGKSCFNFRSPDEPLMNELADLTRRGYDASAGRAQWGAEQREERGMAYRKAMSAERSAHQAGHGGAAADVGRAAGDGGKAGRSGAGRGARRGRR